MSGKPNNSTVDLTTEWQWIDGWEDVTHTSHRTSGDLSSCVQGALKTAITLAERQASQGVYRADDVTWELPAVNVKYDPKPGDVITDCDDRDWTVLDVRGPLYNDFWACTSRDLVLAEDLRDTIDHLQGSASVNAYGSRVVSHATVSSGIAARVQEIEPTISDGRGKRSTVRRFMIYLASSLTLTQDDLLQDGSGNQYSITGWRDKASITDLFAVNCELKP